jgi:hypothetical protein
MLRACWAVQAPVGWTVTPRIVHRPGLGLHHEQHVHALEQHGVDVQEVAGQDARRPGFQELPPRRCRPPRHGAETGSRQDPADRSLPHPVPQAEQLALNPPVPPARVLPCQLPCQPSTRTTDR